MIFRAITQAISLLLNPSRMKGRSRATEFAFRTIRASTNGLEGLSASAVRKKLDAVAVKHPSQRKVSSYSRSVGGIDCLMTSPKRIEQPSSVVIYFHGGGYTIGSSKFYAGLLAELSDASESLVVAPDYRLAPENPHPAPQDDCLKVAQAVVKTYADHKIILAGDSAGGGLAVNVALSLRASNQLALIDSIVLLSPWVDPSATTGSMQSNLHTDFLNVEFLNASIAALLPDISDLQQRVSHPDICFKQADFTGLPKTLVQYGGAEIFADQIKAFCSRVQEAGITLTEQCYVSQYHVFQLGSAIDPEARQAMLDLAEFVST